ncbi:MAG: cell surface protein, partial [Bacteroidaceae bacterium]
MKKKYLSAFLFATLLCGGTGTFTSCNDYDDDISGLQDEIKTNATDLSGLVNEKVKNLENEISSLKSTQESLDAAYKAADGKLSEAITAANDAVTNASLKAAAETEAAKVASIAAAQELVK